MYISKWPSCRTTRITQGFYKDDSALQGFLPSHTLTSRFLLILDSSIHFFQSVLTFFGHTTCTILLLPNNACCCKTMCDPQCVTFRMVATSVTLQTHFLFFHSFDKPLSLVHVLWFSLEFNNLLCLNFIKVIHYQSFMNQIHKLASLSITDYCNIGIISKVSFSNLRVRTWAVTAQYYQKS